MSKNSTGMIPFSLAEMMLMPVRKVRTVLLGRHRFLVWTPRFFTRHALRINMIFPFRVGLFDTNTEFLVTEMRTMNRPVQISSWGAISLYKFGAVQSE